MEAARSRWERSLACEETACVEVSIGPSEVLVRDSKDPDGPVLRFTMAEWRSFLVGAEIGQFQPENRPRDTAASA